MGTVVVIKWEILFFLALCNQMLVGLLKIVLESRMLKNNS